MIQKITSWCDDLVKPHSIKVHCDPEKTINWCGDLVKPHGVKVRCDPQNNKLVWWSCKIVWTVFWGDIMEIPAEVG